MTRRISLTLGASAIVLALMAVAGAATIYRWTDDKGKTHFSDVVPQRYQKSAKPVDLPATTPTSEQQRQAIEQAAKDKARAAKSSSNEQVREAPAPASAASAPASAKRPPVAPNENTDCTTWRRLYQESLECFAPYRTTRGSTKAEAFDRCTPVDEPPVRCGRDAR
jgi:hypothetical protein